MTKRYEAWIPPAKPMKAIGENKWFARAKVKQLKSGHSSDFINLPGEWHGKTKEEAEAKSRRVADEWISEREDS